MLEKLYKYLYWKFNTTFFIPKIKIAPTLVNNREVYKVSFRPWYRPWYTVLKNKTYNPHSGRAYISPLTSDNIEELQKNMNEKMRDCISDLEIYKNFKDKSPHQVTFITPEKCGYYLENRNQNDES